MLLTGIAAALAVIFCVGAYFLPAGFFQSLLVNLGTTLFGIAIVLLLVNIYLGGKSRRSAVRALAAYVYPSVRANHKSIWDDLNSAFGSVDFDEMVKKYVRAGSKPDSLAPQERSTLYSLFVNNESSYKSRFGQFDDDLKELSTIVGWSLDPTLLGNIFRCRGTIARLRAMKLDGTSETQLSVSEHILDFYVYGVRIGAQLLRR